MSEWLDCIVSYIDLVGISTGLDDEATEAIAKMRAMHRIAYSAATQAMPSHEHIYYWNDSILLLALPTSTHDYEPIMKEANRLKRAVDKVCPSYAISMKGQTIPEAHPHAGVLFGGAQNLQPKAVYIRASSLAFSNCFEVEKKCRKFEKKAQWYVDERIARYIATPQPARTEEIALFPRRTKRLLYLFSGDLWNEDFVAGTLMSTTPCGMDSA